MTYIYVCKCYMSKREFVFVLACVCLGVYTVYFKLPTFISLSQIETVKNIIR